MIDSKPNLIIYWILELAGVVLNILVLAGVMTPYRTTLATILLIMCGSGLVVATIKLMKPSRNSYC